MRRLFRTSATVLSAVGLLSCTDTATAPHGITTPDGARRDLLPNHPSLIISQIYGGGGNSGATFTNDFIEIFNPGYRSGFGRRLERAVRVGGGNDAGRRPRCPAPFRQAATTSCRKQ